jgi:hypothetical protein
VVFPKGWKKINKGWKKIYAKKNVSFMTTRVEPQFYYATTSHFTYMTTRKMMMKKIKFKRFHFIKQRVLVGILLFSTKHYII